MSLLLETLERLIRFNSITPHDRGCQELMMDFLLDCGFQCHRLNNPPVSNFFASIGTQKPLLVFAGHTDVVPVGDAAKWHSPPFQLTERNGVLFGRGVADMKGSLAAMLVMAKQFVNDFPNFDGSLGFLITSGEEGNEFDLGTPFVMERLQERGISIDYCIVGEPSSTQQVGDVIKIGRRGSLTGKLTLQGKQGHVAYPHLAENPIHRISPALNELSAKEWDRGNAHFPPTSLQITHIHSGGEANNIIPGSLQMDFNLRFSTEQTAEKLQEEIHACFERHDLKPKIDWRVNGQPFLTSKGKLLQAAQKAIKDCTGKNTQLSTSGGTSDGRFIAPYGVEVIELGPVNATIHQVDECASLLDLESLQVLYYTICKLLLVDKPFD